MFVAGNLLHRSACCSRQRLQVCGCGCWRLREAERWRSAEAICVRPAPGTRPSWTAERSAAPQHNAACPMCVCGRRGLPAEARLPQALSWTPAGWRQTYLQLPSQPSKVKQSGLYGCKDQMLLALTCLMWLKWLYCVLFSCPTGGVPRMLSAFWWQGGGSLRGGWGKTPRMQRR